MLTNYGCFQQIWNVIFAFQSHNTDMQFGKKPLEVSLKKIETSSKINKPSFPHPNLISFTIVRKENRNLRKIPTPQLVKYKYYKKILHIPQCWYHHQSHARFRQADYKSTAAYTVLLKKPQKYSSQPQYKAAVEFCQLRPFVQFRFC